MNAEPDPFDGLATNAIAAIREGYVLPIIRAVTLLRAYADDVIEENVSRSRQAGHSWDAIAGSLQVTRQAAWQRFKHVDQDMKPGRRYIDGSHGTYEVEEAMAPGDQLRSEVIWSVLVHKMPRDRWVPLQSLYQIVSRNVELTDRDEESVPGSTAPRWQRNVRNVLQRRKNLGDIDWDGGGGYLLPS